MSRTANGTIHCGTRLIPSEEFLKEQEYLKPYVGTPELKEEKLMQYHVRKDNIITYRGNYYTVPTGTYHGHNTIVYIEEKGGMLYIYSTETGKTIATHNLCVEKGKLVRNTDHMRNREAVLNDYEASVRSSLPNEKIVDDYFLLLRDAKRRNYRDNLQIIARKASLYTQRTILDAFSMCMDASIYNGCDLMNVAERIRINKKEELLKVTSTADETVPSADTYNLIPERTDIKTFKAIFNEN